ncbi:MAG: hypothetical protein CTY38_01150 [Methylotenera sp.]|uniref:hypothetical protein n=1 Tax=Methylotenera sp. TaxID=2051956 RepID=UPI000D4DF8C2|nr:hypothetical protein [Methylotenera sp.]PPC84683.1 MAG: hypothetical protein CTY38_01150 [Methylotenera sp.]
MNHSTDSKLNNNTKSTLELIDSIIKPEIYNLDNHVRDYQIMVRRGELNTMTRIQMVAFTKGWAMGRGFPYEKATEFSDYLDATSNFFLNEGEVTYQAGIEGAERWTLEQPGAEPKVRVFDSIEAAVEECNDFLYESRKEDLDYTADDIQIFEFVSGVEVRELSFGEAEHYVKLRDGQVVSSLTYQAPKTRLTP